MPNLTEGQILKQRECGGWLATGGVKYKGSHVVADFLRITLPFLTIDHDANKIEVRLPSVALKYFGDNRSHSDLIPKFFGRRQGDSAIVVADSLKSDQIIEFRVKYDLTEMVASIR